MTEHCGGPNDADHLKAGDWSREEVRITWDPYGPPLSRRLEPGGGSPAVFLPVQVSLPGRRDIVGPASPWDLGLRDRFLVQLEEGHCGLDGVEVVPLALSLDPGTKKGGSLSLGLLGPEESAGRVARSWGLGGLRCLFQCFGPAHRRSTGTADTGSGRRKARTVDYYMQHPELQYSTTLN